MPDIRGTTHDCGGRRENVCIDSYRILDSCKDKDCFEDTKLILTEYGQELIDKGGSVRVAKTEVLWTDISTEPVKFNKGFYQVSIRFYTKITLEICVCMGKVQEIEAIAVNEKTVVLFGGEGNVNIFRSSEKNDDFCMCKKDEIMTTNKPSVVVEVVDPIALSVKVSEHEIPNCCCSCCCASEEIPSCVINRLSGSLNTDRGCKSIYVSLGYFSVIRIERPAQFIITATEYSVPDKVCPKTTEEDPCALFAKMSFPTEEFSTYSCGCDGK